MEISNANKGTDRYRNWARGDQACAFSSDSTEICVTGSIGNARSDATSFWFEPDYDLGYEGRTKPYRGDSGLPDWARADFAARAPGRVLVQGDTTTTFAASLAAYYQHIR